MSAFVAKFCTPKRVISVEADPDLIPIIKSTHTLNGTNVDIFNEVLSDAEGWCDFHVSEDFWISSELTTEGRTSSRKICVPATSFQSRLKEWQPNFIMIDIEGGELDLLKNTLPPFVRKLMVEVHVEAYGLHGVKEVMDKLSVGGFAYVPHASSGKVLCYRRL